MRRALPDDIPLLIRLTEFYAESGYELNCPLVAGAFAALLADARLGYVWLIQENGEDVGYLVATIRFGMEYAGPMACLDDLYVIPSHRYRRVGFVEAADRQLLALALAKPAHAV